MIGKVYRLMLNFLFGRKKDSSDTLQLRDTICTKEYFDEYIREESERVKKFEDKIASGTLAADRVMPAKRKLFSIRTGLLIAKYSRGYALDELKSEFTDIARTFGEDLDMGTYDEDLRFLSLCVLFNADNDIKEHAVKLIKESDGYDSIIECLATHAVPDGNTLKYPEVYGDMWEMICKNDTEGIRGYLQKKWYKSHSQAYWYDAHKAKEKLYFGYWAFEIAALMKVLKIDAESLKGVEYFPYGSYSY